MACYDTYRDQLASLYYGHALWVPDPSELYDRVRVGDVGYVKQGHFLRMFNALLPADNDAQEYGVPEGFVPLNMGPFKNVRKLNLFHGDYCSNTVTVDHGDRHQAAGPDEDTSASFRCRSNKGAFLSIPLNGVREDAIRTKAFGSYIRRHCDSWLEFASVNEIDVRLEDIIFVTGCDLTASWAMAVFVNSLDPEISLNARISEAGSARFQWAPTNQPHHNEPNQNVVKSHCVFIRGFRAKRILPFFKTLKAAAEPRPDNPDNEPESSIELLREPAVPDYRDPLIGILNYIAEQHPDQELALAHEDDLKMIEGVDVLTADAVENFLRQNKIPVQSEEGIALLADEDEGVHEEKTSFRARADVDGEQLPLIIHPVLMEYLLKTDIASQPLDYDLGLPTEELLSSAVHPPVHLLVLENDRGLPQNIEVHASDKISEIGVTIEDVLKTVNDCLLKPSGQRERHVHIASNDDDQAIDVSTISDDVVHLTDQDSYMSTSTFVSRSRAPIDQDWWSLSYSGSIYSRSTLVYSDSSSSHEDASSLQQKPYDLSWQPVDEDDEIELIIDVGSEDTNLEVDDLPEVEREERTSAVVIAEEGRGLIVHGDGVAIADLVVQPGTTHLLIGSSRTAGALPQFLTTALPTIGTTLLALDISANFLATLPPALESCVCLEELNISLNPLRSLPLFIAHLTSLRVLIADSTGITTLPAPLSALDRLHTLSIRRNKMYSLPSWLCLLVSLQTLLVDGNSFQGPWKALMEPLLTKGFSGLPYSPSTSILPPLHPTVRDIDSNTDTNATTPSPRSTSFEDSRQNPISLIDVRLSSTGSLGMDIPSTASKISVSPPIIGPKEVDIKEIPLPSGPFLAPSPGLLSVAPSSPRLFPLSLTTRVTERRSFLPVGGPPTLSPPLPSPGPFSSGIALASTELRLPSPISSETIEQVQRQEKERVREAYTRALRSVMAYLRDMNDLSATQLTPTSTYSPSSPDMEGSGPRSRQPTTADSGLVTSDGTLSSFVASRSGSSDQSQTPESIVHLDNLSLSQAGSIASANSKGSINEERKFKDDGGRRMKVIKEIVETERGYVRALQELIDIYIKPAAAPVNLLGGVRSTKETVIPTEERRIVFSGFDSLFSFHKDIFLPALELAADSVLRSLPRRLEEEAEGTLSANAARGIARTFVSHAAFMRMYSTYINNFDHSVQRIKQWVSDRPGTTTGPSPQPPSLAAQATGAGAVNATSDSSGGPQLTSSQRKRIKSFLKRCRRHPRHSQLNLEGYLLAPVSRIPRYRLLLEELARSTPPAEGYLDPLDQALDEISSLATNIIEGKRESESRSKLVQWQSRIRGKFPSPLVQPHRRFIMDGPLPLTRVVRKATTSFEVIDSQGDTSPIQVECLSPEQTPRPLLGILCNDMLVLCRDRSDGKDHLSPVDLWAVLRMQTLPQPASILHGNVLRIVDNKAILYFETSSTTVALNWSRAINLHIPTSKA